MSFKRKTSTGKSLDFGIESPVPGRQDNAGNSPVNAKGQVTDKSGQAVDWPYSPATADEATNPRTNNGVPPLLDNNGRASTGGNRVTPTLG